MGEPGGSLHRHISWAAIVAMPLALAYPVTAEAHCEVGERTFASTVTFDDPCVTDELSLPTVQSFKNGDVPSAQEVDISGSRSFGTTMSRVLATTERCRMVSSSQ